MGFKPNGYSVKRLARHWNIRASVMPIVIEMLETDVSFGDSSVDCCQGLQNLLVKCVEH